MPAIRIQEGASHCLDDIYRYTRDRWGDVQAESYITDLFAALDKIAAQGVTSKPIPAEFGVEGYFFRYEHHFIYWRHLSNGDIGIVTILTPAQGIVAVALRGALLVSLDDLLAVVREFLNPDVSRSG